MFRSKIRLAVFSVVTIGVLTFGLFIDYTVPENPFSVALFKMVYIITPYKYGFLEYYSPMRRDVNNKSVPGAVADFLCKRLERSEDPAETEAIVHLYGMQAGGRGCNCGDASLRTQEKIVAEIMRQLESGTGTYMAKKIVLLDEIRIDSGPGKGSLLVEGIPRFPASGSVEEWVKWSDANEAAVAIPYLKAWWNSGLSWEEKKKIDPFAGTQVRIGYCC